MILQGKVVQDQIIFEKKKSRDKQNAVKVSITSLGPRDNQQRLQIDSQKLPHKQVLSDQQITTLQPKTINLKVNTHPPTSDIEKQIDRSFSLTSLRQTKEIFTKKEIESKESQGLVKNDQKQNFQPLPKIRQLKLMKDLLQQSALQEQAEQMKSMDMRQKFLHKKKKNGALIREQDHIGRRSNVAAHEDISSQNLFKQAVILPFEAQKVNINPSSMDKKLLLVGSIKSTEGTQLIEQDVQNTEQEICTHLETLQEEEKAAISKKIMEIKEETDEINMTLGQANTVQNDTKQLKNYENSHFLLGLTTEAAEQQVIDQDKIQEFAVNLTFCQSNESKHQQVHTETSANNGIQDFKRKAEEPKIMFSIQKQPNQLALNDPATLVLVSKVNSREETALQQTSKFSGAPLHENIEKLQYSQNFNKNSKSDQQQDLQPQIEPLKSKPKEKEVAILSSETEQLITPRRKMKKSQSKVEILTSKQQRHHQNQQSKGYQGQKLGVLNSDASLDKIQMSQQKDELAFVNNQSSSYKKRGSMLGGSSVSRLHQPGGAHHRNSIGMINSDISGVIMQNFPQPKQTIREGKVKVRNEPEKLSDLNNENNCTEVREENSAGFQQKTNPKSPIQFDQAENLNRELLVNGQQRNQLETFESSVTAESNLKPVQRQTLNLNQQRGGVAAHLDQGFNQGDDMKNDHILDASKRYLRQMSKTKIQGKIVTDSTFIEANQSKINTVEPFSVDQDLMNRHENMDRPKFNISSSSALQNKVALNSQYNNYNKYLLQHGCGRATSIEKLPQFQDKISAKSIKLNTREIQQPIKIMSTVKTRRASQDAISHNQHLQAIKKSTSNQFGQLNPDLPSINATSNQAHKQQIIVDQIDNSSANKFKQQTQYHLQYQTPILVESCQLKIPVHLQKDKFFSNGVIKKEAFKKDRTRSNFMTVGEVLDQQSNISSNQCCPSQGIDQINSPAAVERELHSPFLNSTQNNEFSKRNTTLKANIDQSPHVDGHKIQSIFGLDSFQIRTELEKIANRDQYEVVKVELAHKLLEGRVLPSSSSLPNQPQNTSSTLNLTGLLLEMDRLFAKIDNQNVQLIRQKRRIASQVKQSLEKKQSEQRIQRIKQMQEKVNSYNREANTNDNKSKSNHDNSSQIQMRNSQKNERQRLKLNARKSLQKLGSLTSKSQIYPIDSSRNLDQSNDQQDRQLLYLGLPYPQEKDKIVIDEQIDQRIKSVSQNAHLNQMESKGLLKYDKKLESYKSNFEYQNRTKSQILPPNKNDDSSTFYSNAMPAYNKDKPTKITQQSSNNKLPMLNKSQNDLQNDNTRQNKPSQRYTVKQIKGQQNLDRKLNQNRDNSSLYLNKSSLIRKFLNQNLSKNTRTNQVDDKQKVDIEKRYQSVPIRNRYSTYHNKPVDNKDKSIRQFQGNVKNEQDVNNVQEKLSQPPLKAQTGLSQKSNREDKSRSQMDQKIADYALLEEQVQKRTLQIRSLVGIQQAKIIAQTNQINQQNQNSDQMAFQHSQIITQGSNNLPLNYTESKASQYYMKDELSDEINFGSVKKSNNNLASNDKSIRKIVENMRFIEPNFAETPQWFNHEPSCLVSSTRFQSDSVRAGEKDSFRRRREIGIVPQVVAQNSPNSKKSPSQSPKRSTQHESSGQGQLYANLNYQNTSTDKQVFDKQIQGTQIAMKKKFGDNLNYLKNYSSLSDFLEQKNFILISKSKSPWFQKGLKTGEIPAHLAQSVHPNQVAAFCVVPTVPQVTNNSQSPFSDQDPSSPLLNDPSTSHQKKSLLVDKQTTLTCQQPQQEQSLQDCLQDEYHLKQTKISHMPKRQKKLGEKKKQILRKERATTANLKEIKENDDLIQKSSVILTDFNQDQLDIDKGQGDRSENRAENLTAKNDEVFDKSHEQMNRQNGDNTTAMIYPSMQNKQKKNVLNKIERKSLALKKKHRKGYSRYGEAVGSHVDGGTAVVLEESKNQVESSQFMQPKLTDINLVFN